MVDSNETRQRIGDIIKKARLKKGLTQKQLGNIIGKKDNVLTNWEKGINSPDVYMIELLASILDIPVSEMFPSISKANNQNDKFCVRSVSRIEEFRTSMGINQKDFAELLGMTPSSYSRFKNMTGEIKMVPLESIDVLGKKFGINPAWLLGFEDVVKYDLKTELLDLKKRIENLLSSYP
jgi:Predicted transcription factor, homolog of eukaryotic MBF1